MRETWFKSSYSGGNNDCLEARWAKSSYSGGTGGNCVECRADRGQVEVRDSTRPAHGQLAFPAPEWDAFIAAVRRGEL